MKTKPNELTIRFGGLSDPIAKQLKEQGFKCSRIKKWQADADAIFRLYMGGYISESLVTKARRRLLKGLEREIKNEN